MGQAVYLAGKIGPADWRHKAVVGLDAECHRLYGERDQFAWRLLRGAVFGEHDYAGPFFVRCGHGGCYHGANSHGVGADSDAYCKGDADDVRARQRKTVLACLRAAAAADIVFAWLDDPTAHGTLVELGYVIGLNVGRAATAAKRRVIVARPHSADDLADAWGGHGGPVWEQDELWFASALPVVEHVRAADPIDALRLALRPPRVKFASPAEEKFWAAWQAAKGPLLQAQHKVLGGKYRLDFAHLASKTAIEVDGLAYHDGQEAFRRDHARQRQLTQLGWRVIRFTAKEVFADARRCAREAMALCAGGGVVEVRRPARLTDSNSGSNGSNGSNSGSNG